MSIADNVEKLRARIEAAATRAGRDARDPVLVAVGKGHPPAAIAEAADAGLTVFGESRIQELKAKTPLAPSSLEWHFIGHLQTNKCREAVTLCRLVHGVDSERLARALDTACDRLSRTLPILLEVNVSGESTKHGFTPEGVLDTLPSLDQLERLEIRGLMTMAPWSPDPEASRPHFRRLRELATRAEAILGSPLPHLSMGMSRDFEVAIEEGATLVRIGTAIFGRRRAG